VSEHFIHLARTGRHLVSGFFIFMQMQHIYMLENNSDVPIIHVGRGCDRYLTVEECDEIIARAKAAKLFAKRNNVALLNLMIWRQVMADSPKTNSQKKPRLTNIYLMIDKNTGLHKIGRSQSPLDRERTLQSEKPTIEIVFHAPATVEDEKHLHETFGAKRVRGEWFNLNDSDLNFINEYFQL
jgi:hypothetical protein